MGNTITKISPFIIKISPFITNTNLSNNTKINNTRPTLLLTKTKVSTKITKTNRSTKTNTKEILTKPKVSTKTNIKTTHSTTKLTKTRTNIKTSIHHTINNRTLLTKNQNQNQPNYQQQYQNAPFQNQAPPQQQPPQGEPIREMFEAQPQRYYDAVALPPVDNTFSISPGHLKMLFDNQFRGEVGKENPHNHLRTFRTIASTFGVNGMTADEKMLRMFPFSLAGIAKEWFDNTIPRGSVHTWDALERVFLERFYPPSLTMQARKDIANFCQKQNEGLGQAWERYSNMLIECPQHGYTDSNVMAYFYCGACPNDKQHLDACARGAFLNQSAEVCREIVEGIVRNAGQWDDGQRHRNVYQVDQNVGTHKLIRELSEQVKNLQMNQNFSGGGYFMNDHISQQGFQQEEANYMGRPNYNQGGYQQVTNRVTTRKGDLHMGNHL